MQIRTLITFLLLASSFVLLGQHKAYVNLESFRNETSGNSGFDSSSTLSRTSAVESEIIGVSLEYWKPLSKMNGVSIIFKPGYKSNKVSRNFENNLTSSNQITVSKNKIAINSMLFGVGIGKSIDLFPLVVSVSSILNFQYFFEVNQSNTSQIENNSGKVNIEYIEVQPQAYAGHLDANFFVDYAISSNWLVGMGINTGILYSYQHGSHLIKVKTISSSVNQTDNYVGKIDIDAFQLKGARGILRVGYKF